MQAELPSPKDCVRSRRDNGQLPCQVGGVKRDIPFAAAVVPFERSQVSVPDSVADAPYVHELALAEPDHMVRPPVEVKLWSTEYGEFGRHVDPALRRKPLSYGKFARCMHSIGLISCT